MSGEIETSRHQCFANMSVVLPAGIRRSPVGRYAKSKPDSFDTYGLRLTPATGGRSR